METAFDQQRTRVGRLRIGQAEALNRPSLGLGASATAARTDPPTTGAINSTTIAANLQGKYSVYNAANAPTIDVTAHNDQRVQGTTAPTARPDTVLSMELEQGTYDVRVLARDAGGIPLNGGVFLFTPQRPPDGTGIAYGSDERSATSNPSGIVSIVLPRGDGAGAPHRRDRRHSGGS